MSRRSILMQLRRLGPAVLAIAVLALSSLPARAQTGQPDPAGQAEGSEQEAPPPETVTETITVTASRSGERPVTDLPVSVTVVSQEEIEKAPAVTVDDLLRTVPSVELPVLSSTTNLPINPSVAIRGLGLGDNATRTLVLLDGLPLNGAFFGSVPWNRVSLVDLDRVEVVRGASSSLFGSYAMAGVIQLVTRPPASSNSFVLDAKGGSQSTYQVNAFGSVAPSDRFRLSANVQGFRTDGYFLLAPEDRGAIDERTGDESRSGGVKAELEASSRLRLHARANAYKEEQDGETRLGGNESEVRELTAGLDWQSSPASHMSAALSYLDEDFHIDNVNLLDDSRDADFVSNAHDTPADSFGTSVQWSRQLTARDTILTLGADYRSISGEDDAEIFSAPGVLAFRKIGSGDQTSLGLFAEAGFSPHQTVEVQVSLRADRFETSNGRDVTDGVVTEFPDKQIEELSPRLGIRWQMAQAVALRGAVYRGFRAPTLAELYRAFGNVGFQGLPNPLLEPERLNGGEIGLDFVTGRVFTEINGFYNQLEDLVGGVVVEFDPVFTIRNENLGEARSQGFELFSTATLPRGWSLSASYVFTDSEVTDNLDDPSLVGNEIEGTSKHAANLNIGFQATPKLSIQARGRYRSSLFQDATNETLVPSYEVFDAAVSYDLSDLVTLSLDVSNVLDEEYTASAFGGLNRRGSPRQWLLGVRLRNRS